MNLLTKESIALFKNITSINDGFRVPDLAYVHGKEFECFEQLGGDMYFSNFWYGDKVLALAFAEKLAAYFKEQYDNTPLEEDCYDFYGMVIAWEIGDKALVANINLDDTFAFYSYQNGVPDELVDALEDSQLKQILNDGNDNSVFSLIYPDSPEDELKDLFTCLSVEGKEDFIKEAKDTGIKINFLS